MHLTGYIDVLIPRGGKGLIARVLETATVPVIETGAGNCHIYIDQSADLAVAALIVVNAKVQRPSVCNAAEKLLVNQAVAEEQLPSLVAALREHGLRFAVMSGPGRSSVTWYRPPTPIGIPNITI